MLLALMLTIVALGDSTTAGTPAFKSPIEAPPNGSGNVESQYAYWLMRTHPDWQVLNRGVNGDETEDMMARFASGVIAEHPQLVLWQVGTNSVLRDHPLDQHSVQLHEGIDELKATGADVVLIDPQYAPKVLVKSETPGMVEQIAAAAKEENVDLFRRFAVMRNWFEVQHLPFDTFVSPDGLRQTRCSLPSSVFDCGSSETSIVYSTTRGRIGVAAPRGVASNSSRTIRRITSPLEPRYAGVRKNVPGKAPQYCPPEPRQSIQSGSHADRFPDRGDRVRRRPRRPRITGTSRMPMATLSPPWPAAPKAPVPFFPELAPAR